MKTRILDTFQIVNKSIALKKYHAERSYEALRYSETNCTFDEIFNIYSRLENELVHEANEVVRLMFTPTNHTEPIAEFRLLEPLHNPLRLHPQVSRYNLELNRTFKWANRTYWNDLLKSLPPNTDDALLHNEDNEIIETVRFNLFYYSVEENVVITPPLSSGCLNGVLRRAVVDKKEIDLANKGLVKVVERSLFLNDIRSTENLFAGNSVRGLMPAIF